MRSECRGQPIISNIPYASYSGADVAIGVGWRLRIVRAERLERPRNDAAAVRRAGRIRGALRVRQSSGHCGDWLNC